MRGPARRPAVAPAASVAPCVPPPRPSRDQCPSPRPRNPPVHATGKPCRAGNLNVPRPPLRRRAAAGFCHLVTIKGSCRCPGAVGWCLPQKSATQFHLHCLPADSSGTRLANLAAHSASYAPTIAGISPGNRFSISPQREMLNIPPPGVRCGSARPRAARKCCDSVDLGIAFSIDGQKI